MRLKIPSDADLLAMIQAFIAHHGIAPTTFGRNALGDGSLISNLEEGRSLTLRKAQTVIKYMDSYRPREAKPVSDRAAA